MVRPLLILRCVGDILLLYQVGHSFCHAPMNQKSGGDLVYTAGVSTLDSLRNNLLMLRTTCAATATAATATATGTALRPLLLLLLLLHTTTALPGTGIKYFQVYKKTGTTAIQAKYPITKKCY